MKNNDGNMASNGITNERDMRLTAQRRRTRLAIVSGTNISPRRENNHAFAGLTSTEAYDRTVSPARMSISTREVIPNIRFSDERTFELSCAGICKHGVIAIGSHGCVKLLTERTYFENGLRYVIEKLEPTTIVVYGAAPDEIFAQYKKKGVTILQFDSDFMKSRKAVSA